MFGSASQPKASTQPRIVAMRQSIASTRQLPAVPEHAPTPTLTKITKPTPISATARVFVPRPCTSSKPRSTSVASSPPITSCGMYASAITGAGSVTLAPRRPRELPDPRASPAHDRRRDQFLPARDPEPQHDHDQALPLLRRPELVQ